MVDDSLTGDELDERTLEEHSPYQQSFRQCMDERDSARTDFTEAMEAFSGARKHHRRGGPGSANVGRRGRPSGGRGAIVLFILCMLFLILAVIALAVD